VVKTSERLGVLGHEQLRHPQHDAESDVGEHAADHGEKLAE
jgi:hypothetical protein